MDYFFDWNKAGDNHVGVAPVFTVDEIINKVDELAGRLIRWFDTEPVAQMVRTVP